MISSKTCVPRGKSSHIWSMEKLNRGDKIYLDADNTKESEVNYYLDCRDGVVECYEYTDEGGYGLKTRLFYCRNYKHETKAIIRQTYSWFSKEWMEESLTFDTYGFDLLVALVNGNKKHFNGTYSLVRDYYGQRISRMPFVCNSLSIFSPLR